jgi:hypothetical protein
MREMPRCNEIENGYILVGVASAVDDDDDEEDEEDDELLNEKKDLAMNWRKSSTS